jgi:hypothetical protein
MCCTASRRRARVVSRHPKPTWTSSGNLRKSYVALLQADIDDFIDQAPDGRKSIKRAGKKCAISVSIDPAVLEQLDDWDRGRGIRRAAAIAVAGAKLK